MYITSYVALRNYVKNSSNVSGLPVSGYVTVPYGTGRENKKLFQVSFSHVFSSMKKKCTVQYHYSTVPYRTDTALLVLFTSISRLNYITGYRTIVFTITIVMCLYLN